MIPLCVPHLGGNEGRYLQECVDSTFVSSVGPFVDRLATMTALAAGAVTAVPTASGTTGLHLALAALGIGQNDLVVLPSFTFIASANAISHCGAKPWLMDIDPVSWTLDPILLEVTLEAETEQRGGVLRHKATGARVAAIMPVYTLGQPADMDAICAVAARFGLPVVADAAAAIGSTYKGRPPGQMGALLSVFSFNGNKTVTSGGGGAVFGNDTDLLAHAAHLSSTARAGTAYSHDRVGFNYRMTNLEAAVGCAQLEQLDGFIAAKRRIRARYDQAFGGMVGVGLFPDPEWAESACWFSGLVLDRPAPPVCAALREDGIEARPFWMPVHLQAPYKTCPTTPMPVAERIWDRVITLPCSTNLGIEDQDKVIGSLKRILA
jgi:dTDP-4-amino-4,6-dideoxygalactose transaminase